MNPREMIAAIDEEISRLQQIRELLALTTVADTVRSAAAEYPVKKKRVLSAEARAKIAAAQKRRWAKQKMGTAKDK